MERIQTVKPEFTGKRDLSYNTWHRTLGQEFYMVDLDCVEWRKGRGIVAIIERGLDMGAFPRSRVLEFKKFELFVVSELARKCSVPAFLVFYKVTEENEPYIFDVYKIQDGQPTFLKTMATEEYVNFIRGL